MRLDTQQHAWSESSYTTNWHEILPQPIASTPKDPIYVIPDGQAKLQQELLVLQQNAFIIELASNDSIQFIVDAIKQHQQARIIFISQSSWQAKRKPETDTLFLNFLKALSTLRNFQLDIVAINCLPLTNIEETTNPLDAINLGLGRTFAKENPQAQTSIFNVNKLDQASLTLLLKNRFPASPLSPIFIHNNKCHIQKLLPTKTNGKQSRKGFRHNGCYVIIGGTGGIGRLLANYLSEKYSAKIILAARNVPSDLQELESTGNIIYHSLDLTQPDSVAALFEKYPEVNGVIHSALVLDDASILSMTSEQLQRVLAPKVQGSVNLVNSIAYKSLDFILFFSSIQSFIANAGQANYTAACLCKDAIAKMLANIFNKNVTIINWGYWGELGVVANDFYRERMQKIGVHSITPDEGLAAIEAFLRDEKQQFTYVKATRDALIEMGLSPSEHAARNVQPSKPSILPPFHQDSPEVTCNKNSMQALNHYAQHQFHRLVKPTNIVPKYQRLWDAAQVIPNPSALNRQELLHQYPEVTGHVNLLDSCLENFNAIVSGQQDPLSVLFPDGSFRLVESVYRNNPVANYYNQQVSSAVQNAIATIRMNSARPIRILEVGAGTGSTSEVVIPQVNDMHVEYFYTDISPIFLNQAKQKFKQFHFIEYTLFDMEKGSKDLGKFDIIFATNAVHATRNISQCIKNFADISNEHGVLILNEITERQDFATLTFGLTDGWWLSQDELRIPNSPLLCLDTWLSLLRQNGYQQTSHHGGFGQHIIVGQIESIEPLQVPDTANLATNKQHNIQHHQSNMESNEIKTWLRQLISDVMHLPPGELADDVPFKDYGIDSLITLELLKPMNERVGYVPATLLFEYPNLNLLSDYFKQNHASYFTNEEQHASTTELAMTGNAQPQQADIETLRSIIANVLYLPTKEIKDDIPFKDIGIDSLISLELITAMQKHYGYLPATTLFEFPTLGLLASYICESGLTSSSQQHPKAQAATEPTRRQVVTVAQFEATTQSDDIAIVGIAGQFPGADNCNALWDLLSNGEVAISTVPSERWSAEFASKSYTQVGGFIHDIDCFDHQFFKILPIDAERIDPQERLFLQNAFHAIEDAGYKLSDLDGHEVGCYVGVMNHGYSLLTPNNQEQNAPSSLFWSIANRVSYQFNWTGPSFAIDSACSSSLTAIHTAVSALRQGDCTMALVGGVNLITHPQQYDVLCQQHMLSADGVCRPFGEGANGFVDGEGVASVVLMPLSEANKANRRIYGVIRGSAINAGGKTNGYTAPNPSAQAITVSKALQKARLTAADISYIEAHGTGTVLGDPIEVAALAKIYGGVNNTSIPLGSIKGNIGHLESAAGLASVIKILLQMKHNMLLPSVNSTKVNHLLNVSQTPFYINQSLQPWQQTNNQPRRACVSSFGAGGANAHIIIEQAPHVATQPFTQRHYFFPLSAHSYAALQTSLLQLNKVSQQLSYQDLYQLSYAYCCQRAAHKYRAGFIVTSLDQLKNITASSLPSLLTTNKPSTEAKNIDNVVNQFNSTGRQNDRLAVTLIEAFNIGTDVNWSALFNEPAVTSIPNYPFDKHCHWIDAKESQFKNPQSIITQHRIQNQCMAPAAFTLSALLKHHHTKSIRNIVWKNIITDINNVDVQLNNNLFQLVEKHTRNCYSEASLSSTPTTLSPLAVIQSAVGPAKQYNHQEIYQIFKRFGYDYGPKYQTIYQASVGTNSVRSIIIISEDWGYQLSPALFDAALQSAILLEMSDRNLNDNYVKVPFLTDQVEITRVPELNEPLYCTCVQKSNSDAKRTIYDIDLSDVHGNLCMAIRGVLSVRASSNSFASNQKSDTQKPLVSEVELN